MQARIPLIGTGQLNHDALKGQVAVVTGAGSGIGYEAAHALAWLGARVAIAEVDKGKGQTAAECLNQELGARTAVFIHTDVGEEQSIQAMAQQVLRALGPVDIVLNNAAIEPMGAVKDVPIARWDASYRVNLRGPVLLARAFLPGMLQRHRGVFVCVSSVGGPYMGAYEVFKGAQVALANTLDAELDGTGVIALTIGPGIVRTAGAEAGIRAMAPLMGKTVAEIYEMNKAHLLSVEAAGAGFAAAIALAPQFRGQEISSIQALISAGISVPAGEGTSEERAMTAAEREQAVTLARQVVQTLTEQSEGWKHRSVFERAWVIRDFKKTAGMPAEEWLARLEELADALENGRPLPGANRVPLDSLAEYYRHLKKMATDYLQREPEKLNEQTAIVQRWVDEVEALISLTA